jgi:hypothetical protein
MLVGGAFGFFSYISAETAWQAALVLGVVSYLTGLAFPLGPELGRAGYVLLLWTGAVLIGEAHGGDPPATALTFLIGGAVAMLVVAAAGAVTSGPRRRRSWGSPGRKSRRALRLRSEARCARASACGVC